MAKFCSKCGAQLEDSMVFCNKCGARQDAAPAQAPVTPNYSVGNSYNNFNTGTKLSADGGTLSSSKIMRLLAAGLALLAIILFVATPILSSDQKLTGSVVVSDGYYGYARESMNETNTETGKLLEVLDTSDMGISETEMKMYGIDVGGIKTMKTIAIAILIISVIGVVALLIPAFAKTPYDSICSITGIISQVAMIGGTAIVVFGMFAKEYEKLTSKLLPLYIDSYQYSGLNVEFEGVAINITSTFTAWGWIFLCVCAFSILTAVKGMQMSKADAK